jgi:glutamyl-tRNA synthetase
MAPRVRFAPSPTGYLHVGGARTALFNWLFARQMGGVFVLRIEDTDVERSSSEMVQGILDGLRWLGLDWDEGPLVGGSYGPYFQSERLDRYRALAQRLVAEGHAYYCYCSPAELDAKREAAERAGIVWRYDRTCLGLSAEQIAEREARGDRRAIRFLVPAGTMRYRDLVRGTIAFDAKDLDDFIIQRSDGHPTYHLSVVSDDIEMEITHVVRGDDHISNTPKQILLYEAAGAPVPEFAHVPLIFGPDRKRLSKRHGATSVMEYAKQGYLPDAMVNFLALLGWSAGGERELFRREELIDAFTLEGIGGGNPVFNVEKLDWFNSQYIAMLAPDELARQVKPYLEAAGIWDETLLTERHAWFFAVLELLTSRVRRLGDFVERGWFFFSDKLRFSDSAIQKHLNVTGMAAHLDALTAAFSALATFDASSTEASLREIAAARNVKAATLIHAVRVAVTGESVSPGLFDVLALVGRERSLERLRAAARMISAPRA